jgi:hypothetical protein
MTINDTRLTLDPRIGEIVLKLIELENPDRDFHVVIIACPVEDDGKLGQPAFVTSLMPEDTEQLLIQIAGNFALMKKPPIIDGVHVSEN